MEGASGDERDGLGASIFRSGRRFALLPTRANGQPAFGVYLGTAAGPRPGVGVFVIELSGARIRAMTRFENTLLTWFGLPDVLPACVPICS
jgi:RNA polymerase sigma-70 factor (ECF subfamily)